MKRTNDPTFGNGAPQPVEDRKQNQFSGASGLLFEQAMAQTRMAVCLTDPTHRDNPIVFANRAFYALTGYEEHEVVGRNCRFLQGADTDPAALERLRQAIANEDVCIDEVLNYRKDGTSFWNALHLGPIYRADGALQYYFGSQWNVSDVHAARAGEQHARMLARELSHRVKNMFSVITAIVALTARYERAPRVVEKINGRIRALARAYEATLDGAHDQRIVLSDVVRMVLEPHRMDRHERIRMSGPEVRLEPGAVSALGLTLHELATNAIKYGALGSEQGSVAVTWRVSQEGDERFLVLAWKERGGPAIRSAPASRGMGSGIIDSLIGGAGGEVATDWAPDGLHSTVRLPIGP